MQNTAILWRQLGQVILGLGLTGLFFYMMAPFLLTLIFGVVIALICEPIFRRLCGYGLPRSLSGLITTLGASLVGIVPLAFVGITVAIRLGALLKSIQLPRMADLAALPEHPFVVKLIHRIPPWLPVDQRWLQEQGLSMAQKFIEKASELLGTFISQIPGLFLGFLVVVVTAYFLMVDGKRFTQFLLRISPLAVGKSHDLFNAFANSCRGVVIGMLASCSLQGLCIAVFFAATHIPNALLWGLTGVIMGMVPLIGVAPILLGGILFHALAGNIVATIIVIIGSAITVSADNVVRPWILKGHGEMHPLLGLVSAFGAVSVFGAMGIILGPVIAAVFTAFLEIVASELHPSLAEKSAAK